MTHPDIASAIAHGRIHDMHAAAVVSRRARIAQCCKAFVPRPLLRLFQTRTQRLRGEGVQVACCS
jgi:hypothetical protein